MNVRGASRWSVFSLKASPDLSLVPPAGQQEEAEPIEAHPIDVEEDLDEEPGTGVFWGHGAFLRQPH